MVFRRYAQAVQHMTIGCVRGCGPSSLKQQRLRGIRCRCPPVAAGCQ